MISYRFLSPFCVYWPIFVDSEYRGSCARHEKLPSKSLFGDKGPAYVLDPFSSVFSASATSGNAFVRQKRALRRFSVPKSGHLTAWYKPCAADRSLTPQPLSFGAERQPPL